MHYALVCLVFGLAVSAVPMVERRAEFTLANGKAAQALNKKFDGDDFNENTPCNGNEVGCIGNQIAKCFNGKFSPVLCVGQGQDGCFAVPLDDKPGTTIKCVSLDEATRLIAKTGATGGVTGESNQ